VNPVEGSAVISELVPWRADNASHWRTDTMA
jgi:hypothetical protein